MWRFACHVWKGIIHHGVVLSSQTVNKELDMGFKEAWFMIKEKNKHWMLHQPQSIHSCITLYLWLHAKIQNNSIPSHFTLQIWSAQKCCWFQAIAFKENLLQEMCSIYCWTWKNHWRWYFNTASKDLEVTVKGNIFKGAKLIKL